ncbi:hypothetical protein STXM2123_2966 [Streptomyces sp. F-3]|nr:hypothetical protein STXM2123_2966 [Streptomyces sp. F-3]
MDAGRARRPARLLTGHGLTSRTTIANRRPGPDAPRRARSRRASTPPGDFSGATRRNSAGDH